MMKLSEAYMIIRKELADDESQAGNVEMKSVVITYHVNCYVTNCLWKIYFHK